MSRIYHHETHETNEKKTERIGIGLLYFFRFFHVFRGFTCETRGMSDLPEVIELLSPPEVRPHPQFERIDLVLPSCMNA